MFELNFKRVLRNTMAILVALFLVGASGLTQWTTIPVFAATSYEIDCGGSGDNYYSGSTATVSTSSTITTLVDQSRYQTARKSTVNDLTYTLPIDNGNYDVKLGFCELETSTLGARQQDVYIQGTFMRPAFDIYKSSAQYVAVDLWFNNVSVTNGSLVIKLSKSAGSVLYPSINILTVRPHHANLLKAPGYDINTSSYSGTAAGESSTTPRYYNDKVSYWADDFAKIKELGVNTLKIWGGDSSEYMDYDGILTRMDQEGVRAAFTIYGHLNYDIAYLSTDEAYVQTVINKYKSHPCIWGWQIGSESILPMENKGQTKSQIYQYFRGLYNAAKAADPAHPCYPGLLRTETATVDSPVPVITTLGFWDLVGLQDYWTMKPYSSRYNVRKEVQSYYPKKQIYTTEYGESEYADDDSLNGVNVMAKNWVNMHDVDKETGDIGGCQFELIDDSGQTPERENHFGTMYNDRTVKYPMYDAVKSRYMLQPMAKPDYTITNLTFSPSTFSTGNTVTLTATVKNTGDASGGATATVFFVDGAWVNWVYTPALAAGASADASVVWTATSANMPVLSAICDYNDEVDESNEDNNTLKLDYIPMKNPDIQFTGYGWTPYIYSVGQNVTLEAIVRNNGNANYNSNTKVVFVVDGNYAGEGNVASLSSGASRYFTCNWTAAAGSHEFRYDLYSCKQYQGTRTVLSSDLLITNLSYSPANPDPGDTVTLKASVMNRGDADTNSNFSVRFLVDGVGIGWQALGILGPNGVGDYTYSWTATSGNHDFQALADCNNEVTNEYSKNNNDETIAMPVLPADLIVDSISCNPSNPDPGDTVTVTANIKNQGTAASNAVCNVDFYIDGKWLSASSMATLNANSTVNKTAAWTATQGRHIITAQVDGDGAVTNEISKANNEGTMMLYSIGTGSDLVVKKIWFNPAAPTAGNLVTIYATVKNQGSSAANSSSTLKFSLAGNSTGTASVNSLAAGAEQDVSITWTAASGYNVITATVDSTNAVTNENEKGNNSLLRILNVP